MVDEPKNESKDPAAETIFNSSIGDDWGEAFEAEDFMASPEEDASSEFFLPDEPTASSLQPGSASPSAEEARPSAAKKPPLQPAVLGNTLRTRFCTLPLSLRIASTATPILLGIALILFLNKAPSQPTTEQPEVVQKALVADQTTTNPTSPEPPKLQTEPAPRQPDKPPIVSATPNNKEIHKKWHFPAIIVQAKTTKNQEVTILSTDLTLTLKLHPEIMLPSAKDSFIREMIYQFYSNQPPDDLRRFALERGEMTRKMQAWITKQWPGLPLESIKVDRYQVL